MAYISYCNKYGKEIDQGHMIDNYDDVFGVNMEDGVKGINLVDIDDLSEMQIASRMHSEKRNKAI